jgi:hypothetical protein
MPNRRNRHHSPAPQATNRVDIASPGYYRMRHPRSGAWVPVEVVLEIPRDPVTREPMDRAPILRLYVDGYESTATLARVWPSLHPIRESEYRALAHETADVDHAAGLMTHPVRL